MTRGPSIDLLPALLEDLQRRVQHGKVLHHKFLYQSSRPANPLERRMLEQTISKLKQEIRSNRDLEQTVFEWEMQAQTLKHLSDLKLFKGTLDAHQAVQEAVLLAAQRLLEHPRLLTGKFGERNLLHLPLLEAVVREHETNTREVLELLQQAGDTVSHLDPDTLAHLREVQHRQDRDTQVFLQVVEGWQKIPDIEDFQPRLLKLQQDLQHWRVSIVKLGELLP